MSNKHFNTCISSNNKIWRFMSFTKDDKVLRDFIDYLRFHTSWNNKPLLQYLHRDNWKCLNFSRLSLNIYENSRCFNAMIQTVVYWQIVKICDLREIKINWKLRLMVSLYWKWLKVLRDDYSLYQSLKCFFTDWLELWEDLTITRIDYTVDCAKLNFRKQNSLNNKKWWYIFADKETNVETKYFGVKSHDSAMFIRYYDKKKDLVKSDFLRLYPEYKYLDQVMRYELSVNSKWLDDYERNIKLNSLYDLINLGYDIPFRNRKWEKDMLHWKDETLLNTCVKNINLMKNIWDIDSLDKLYCYLDSIYRKNKMSLPIYLPLVWDSD